MENPTRFKLQEAEYFLTLMEKSYGEDQVFLFNLSAFLCAARSITFYLQKQYVSQLGFAEWYCAEQIRMTNDSELQYMNKARVEVVHKEFVRTGATRDIAMTARYCIKGENMQEQRTTEIEDAQTRVLRFFPEFNNTEVIEFCKRQLRKLELLVTECERKYPQK